MKAESWTFAALLLHHCFHSFCHSSSSQQRCTCCICVLQPLHFLVTSLSSQSPRNRAASCLFSPAPSFSPPLHHLRLYFDAYVLFIHSSQIRSQEIRDICCTHFEDASCCSITCRAKVLFAFSGIGSAWLTGGGTPRARRLINKIFYVNATKERERWDH